MKFLWNAQSIPEINILKNKNISLVNVVQEVKLRDNSLLGSTTLLVRKAMDTNKQERLSNLSKGTPPLLLLYRSQPR